MNDSENKIERANNIKVGELNPSQLLYTFGVGSIVDLPHLSVIVGGLDDWPTDPNYVREVQEDRLLYAVKAVLGNQVQHLASLPVVPDGSERPNPFERETQIGVPVSTFPQWMVCPSCHILAHVDSELFKLKPDFAHPDRTCYQHVNCQRAKTPPTVLPARFLVACEKGHLDDFPWIGFVHNFDESKSDHRSLKLSEYGPSGEARDLYVECNICQAKRQLAEAFGPENRDKMPLCTGRRPHLHDYDPKGCEKNMRAILLGASNLWFSHVLSTIALPTTADKLQLLTNEHWGMLERVESQAELATLQKFGQLSAFSEFSATEIWKAVEQKRRAGQGSDGSDTAPNLYLPEWIMLTASKPPKPAPDFRLTPVAPPGKFASLIPRVVLVERMREVRALVGFTRIDSPGEAAENDEDEIEGIAPISRKSPTWVPTIEVRGEGVFIQLDEQEIMKWLTFSQVSSWDTTFFQAHVEWRKARHFENPEANYPGLRYILLHTFSHALMRQFALESGYNQASIRERIYSNNPGQTGGPMAGILLYTSAPDSEGTLGGLVSLGESKTLERHIEAALEAVRLCASDPTCAEHMPGYGISNIHAAACHACLFAPETSCERGNKYLDRSILAVTVANDNLGFFEHG